MLCQWLTYKVELKLCYLLLIYIINFKSLLGRIKL